MIRYRCDLCGLDLARDGSNHFIVKIEAYAAAGRLEFSEADTRIDAKSEMRRTLAAYQPIGRMGTPEEVASLALYLCSDEAAFVTGQAYPIDGGVLVS